MGCRFWVVEVGCGQFVANGGLRKEIDLYSEEEDGRWFVGMVGMGGLVGFD